MDYTVDPIAEVLWLAVQRQSTEQRASERLCILSVEFLLVVDSGNQKVN